MDWKNRFSNIVNKFKGQLFAKKVEHFAWVYQCVDQFDPKRTGVLTLHDFNLFLNKIGVFLTTQQLRTIRDKFDYNNDATIYYVDFLNAVRSQASPKILETIKAAWQFLDSGSKGQLELGYLLIRYQAQYHPHITTRKKFPEQVTQQFDTGIKLKSANQKTVTEKEFTDYYLDLNSCIPIEREDFFTELILKTWGLTYGPNYIQDILFEKVRQKTGEKFSEGFAAKAAFKYFDLADSGECNLQQFTNALDKFGCKFSKNQISTLFDKYDINCSGTITYNQFCRMFSSIGARGPSPIINPLTTLGKNSIGFNQLKIK